MKDVILTPEGYKQLKSELDLLRTDKRREIAERIAAAREFGEIAENAEYDDAKNEQAMHEHRTAHVDDALGIAEAIDWVAALSMLGIERLDAAAVDRTLGPVLKYGEDQEVIRAAGLEQLVSGGD